MNDSLKITQNKDGSFTMNWDKKDPAWAFLNHLTSKEIQVIMEQAIKDKTE
jgi:ABC-type glycerol-3-phosphate transport system substrate-binding protein